MEMEQIYWIIALVVAALITAACLFLVILGDANQRIVGLMGVVVGSYAMGICTAALIWSQVLFDQTAP